MSAPESVDRCPALHGMLRCTRNLGHPDTGHLFNATPGFEPDWSALQQSADAATAAIAAMGEAFAKALEALTRATEDWQPLYVFAASPEEFAAFRDASTARWCVDVMLQHPSPWKGHRYVALEGWWRRPKAALRMVVAQQCGAVEARAEAFLREPPTTGRRGLALPEDL